MWINIFFVFCFFSSPNNGHTPTRYQNYKPWTKFGTLWKVYVYGRLWLRALTWCLCYTRWQTHQLEFHTAHQLLGYWPYCMEGHSSWVQSVTIGASWYIEHFAKVGMDMDSCAKEMRKELHGPHTPCQMMACKLILLIIRYCHLVEHLTLLPTMLKGNCWLMAFCSCYLVQSLVLDTTYKFRSMFINTSLSFSPKPYLGL